MSLSLPHLLASAFCISFLAGMHVMPKNRKILTPVSSDPFEMNLRQMMRCDPLLFLRISIHRSSSHRKRDGDGQTRRQDTQPPQPRCLSSDDYLNPLPHGISRASHALCVCQHGWRHASLDARVAGDEGRKGRQSDTLMNALPCVAGTEMLANDGLDMRLDRWLELDLSMNGGCVEGRKEVGKVRRSLAFSLYSSLVSDSCLCVLLPLVRSLVQLQSNSSKTRLMKRE